LLIFQTKPNLPPDIPLICGYDALNALHRRALRGKQASSIVVSKHHRRVDINFSSGVHNWDFYDVSATTVHVPVVDIDIQGLSDEFGVCTTNGIYLSYKNTFTQYLCGLLKKFDYDHSPKDKQLVTVLLSIACNERLLNTKPINKRQYDYDSLFRSITRNAAPYSELLWERIVRNDFISTLFRERYILYRPRDWSRQTSEATSSEYLEEFPVYVGIYKLPKF